MSDKKAVMLPVVAGVVIKKDGKYLLVQENKKTNYGLYNWPAGKVDEGESIEETAIREAKEEVGVDVKLIRKIDIFQANISLPARHAFEAEITNGEPQAQEGQVLSVGWFTPDEMRAMKDKLRSEWVLEAMEMMESK
ncbi:MAG: NUDIX hydrolase [Candidatus Pacebacteria bacterium]|nr:NUDIX hydrolase [Candidatus Paceibacterota bacterium]